MTWTEVRNYKYHKEGTVIEAVRSGDNIIVRVLENCQNEWGDNGEIKEKKEFDDLESADEYITEYIS